MVWKASGLKRVLSEGKTSQVFVHFLCSLGEAGERSRNDHDLAINIVV